MYYVRKDLYTSEKEKSYAKYYYREPALPSAEKLAKMEKPLDPSQCLKIEDRNELLKSGYLEAETGWCVLPDGTGYFANLTIMPEVTAEMFLWWFAWYGLEPMRYKIWWPQTHCHAQVVKPNHRAKLTDSNLPLQNRVAGFSQYVIDDVGAGPVAINIDFLSAEEAGFDMNCFKEPNVAGLVVGNAHFNLLNVPKGGFNPRSCFVLCHFLREIDCGVELRTRSWMGMKLVDKGAFRVMPYAAKLPPFVPQGWAIHNAYELTNLAAILPEIYAEQKGIVEEILANE